MPISQTIWERVLLLDSTNCFGYIQMGNIEYYKPSIFGGSKTEALTYYLKATSLMLSYSLLCLENWNYLNLLIIVAQAYSEMSEYEDAERMYKMILSIEPGFSWVKDELYPQLIKIKEGAVE